MPASPTPDNVQDTVDNIQIGVPYISFAPALLGGGFGAERDLGIVQNADLAKTIGIASLLNSQSGVAVVSREDVKEFRSQLDIGLSEISAANLQYFLASATLTAVSADAAQAVVAEQFDITDDGQDFIELANALINLAAQTIAPGAIVGEVVGTGDGATVQFDLDQKLSILGDLTVITVGGVNRFSDIQAGAPTGTQIQLSPVGAVANSGRLTFGTAPTAGQVILVNYTPSFTLAAGVTGNTYTMDEKTGRIRINDVGPADKSGTTRYLPKQPMAATYTYNRLAHSLIAPFSQFSFNGKATIQLLTNIGTNIIWPVPSVTMRLTDDPFAFSRDDYLVGNLSMILNDVGGSTPFGAAQIYSEVQAAS